MNVMSPDERIEHEECQAWAFGEGGDARHRGRSWRACPYAPSTHMGEAWLAGWKDVEENFGRLARWPFRRLPPVQEVA